MDGVELQEKLSRLSRVGGKDLRNERTLVTATGAMPPGLTIKIVSINSYNLYNVQQVEIITTGINPVQVSGSSVQAYNIAESFTATGTLSAGIYAVMWRVGSNNVFYVKP